MDEILLLPNLCDEQHTRRILHARAVVHPLNGRHIYTWTRIAKLLSTDRRAVQRRHARGLKEVTERIAPERVCRIMAFMAPIAASAPQPLTLGPK